MADSGEIEGGDYIESAFLVAKQAKWDEDEDKNDHNGDLEIQVDYEGNLYFT